jgi:hypothetical protein
MIKEIKSILIDYMAGLSEDIRRIEEDAKSSGLDLISDKRYSYLVGKRDASRYILDKVKSL